MSTVIFISILLFLLILMPIIWWLWDEPPGRPEWCDDLVSCTKCRWVRDQNNCSVPHLNCAWPENITYYNSGAYGCGSRFLMVADKINHDGRCPYYDMSWRWHKKDIQAIEDWVRRRQR